MEPTRELIEALHLDKVRTAEAMSPAEKFIAGARLFDYACEITKAGIRSEHPEADEARILEILRERLEWARRREERA